MAPGGIISEEMNGLGVAEEASTLATCNAELRDSLCRKATAPSGRNLGTSTSNVQDILECPVCSNLMCPPIYQCANGHTLCSSCKVGISNTCLTCRGALGNIRCLALENVAATLGVPCNYQMECCCKILPYSNKLAHEKHCKYRPYNCPYAGAECSVTGSIPLLVTHLQNDHKVEMHNRCYFSHRYVQSNSKETENATWKLTIFNCFGQQFCLHFEAFHLGMAPFYMTFLRFMGDDEEAKKFRYSIEVGRSGRKLTWQGVPRSIRDNHKKVRDSQDGLIIPRRLAHLFSGGNGQELKLKVDGRIWQER